MVWYLLLAGFLFGGEPDAEAGYKILISKPYAPGQFPRSVVDDAWKRWGQRERPANYWLEFRERYGLSEAPFPNENLPMGLRPSPMPLGSAGVCLDCLTCHGGSLMGRSVIGLGNTALDLQTIFEELSGQFAERVKPPYTMCNTRGTNEAGATSVYLGGFRDADLNVTLPWQNFGLSDSMCEDVPAWWLLKRKKWMYATGEVDSRSVRSIMQFMMHPLNGSKKFIEQEENFAKIKAFIISIKPPHFPGTINRDKADQGKIIYTKNCARCHGGRGEDEPYPGKIIPLEVIGTDPTRHAGVPKSFGDFYNSSWFSREIPPGGNTRLKARHTSGYQAPPLDGIWATAPYLHNGSVPTLWHLLRSDRRPKVFTRSFRTDSDAYDWEKIGWRTRPVDPATVKSAKPIEQRKVYDTTLKGRGNGGHVFGDHLTETEVDQVIEYLKTF